MSADAPFFLLYASRSGSTFLARLLIERLGAVIPPESRFLGCALSRPVPRPKTLAILWLDLVLRTDRKFADWNLDRERLLRHLRSRRIECPRDLIDGVIEFYLTEMKSASAGEIWRFGFKKGEYGRFARRILDWYPGAKFICLVRDGRAVFNSQRKALHSETRRPMQYDPRTAAVRWTASIETFERIERLAPRSSILIKYEDLIADPVSTVNGIGAHLGFSIASAPGAAARRPAADLVPKRFAVVHSNVYRQPLAERIDAWQSELPPIELAVFESVARAKLDQYGYGCVTQTPA